MNTQLTTFLFPINIGKIMYGELKVTAERRYNGNGKPMNTELTEIFYQQNDFGFKTEWSNVTNLVTIASPDLDKELMQIACERFYEMEQDKIDYVEDEWTEDQAEAAYIRRMENNLNS